MSHARARVVAALALVERFGLVEGERRKQWVVDQVVRLLLEREYSAWVRRWNAATPNTPWDEGEPCR